MPGPAATTLAESIRATTLRPSRPLPSTHPRLQDDHTTSGSNLGERLRHEENATPGRGTDREPSGVSVRTERPSLARATRSTRIRQALANNGDIPRGRVGGVWWWMHHSWRGVLCLVLGLVRMCVVMQWRVWWLVSRPRRWVGFWGTGVGR